MADELIIVVEEDVEAIEVGVPGPPGAKGDPGGSIPEVSQPDAEAGTSTTFSSWSAQRWRQAAVAWLATVFGTTAGTICQGNDSRLSNSRTPTAHKSSHTTGGGDALAPSDIGALTAVSGTATNLSETKQATITTSVSSIDWSAGHTTINYAGNTVITAINNVPTSGRAWHSLLFKHNGGTRTLTLPGGQVISTWQLAGTAGGYDRIVLEAHGTNEIYVSVVESK